MGEVKAKAAADAAVRRRMLEDEGHSIRGGHSSYYVETVRLNVDSQERADELIEQAAQKYGYAPWSQLSRHNTVSETERKGTLRHSAAVVIQSVVDFGAVTTEGRIVTLLEPGWNAVINLIAQDPNGLTRLSPRLLEELIAAAYDKAGFDEVTLTPRSGDLGRDVIAIKRGFGQIRIIDQVKAYSPGHLVSANDVRALLGVLQSDRSATKGVVTTTSEFAPRIQQDKFIKPFIPYRLELIDGNRLVDRLRELTTTD